MFKKSKRIVFKNIFFIFLMCFISSNLFAKPKVESVSPSVLIQGQKNITLNIITNEPMPQTSFNENLYSEIVFSSPYIRIKEVKFLNSQVINCTVDVDEFSDVSKKIDVNVISFDENGNETVFEGKKLLEISRQTVINRIIIHTFDGKIKIGEKALITIRGANFEKGKLKLVLMMSGLKAFTADSPNTRQVKFEMSAEDTAQLAPGKYNVYVYNKDGSGIKSEMQLEVIS